jgi:acetyltransferase-like isoleucine patch superfamily enzyme
MTFTVFRFAVIAETSRLLPSLNIGEGALVGAHSLVTKSRNANSAVVRSTASYRSKIKDFLLDD